MLGTIVVIGTLIKRTYVPLGLGLFVFAEAVIFVPLLFIAAYASGDATVIFTAIDRADTVKTAALGKILR